MSAGRFSTMSEIGSPVAADAADAAANPPAIASGLAAPLTRARRSMSWKRVRRRASVGKAKVGRFAPGLTHETWRGVRVRERRRAKSEIRIQKSEPLQALPRQVGSAEAIGLGRWSEKAPDRPRRGPS